MNFLVVATNSKKKQIVHHTIYFTYDLRYVCTTHDIYRFKSFRTLKKSLQSKNTCMHIQKSLQFIHIDDLITISKIDNTALQFVHGKKLRFVVQWKYVYC